jgi:hypothetical protein
VLVAIGLYVVERSGELGGNVSVGAGVVSRAGVGACDDMGVSVCADANAMINTNAIIRVLVFMLFVGFLLVCMHFDMSIYTCLSDIFRNNHQIDSQNLSN